MFKLLKKYKIDKIFILIFTVIIFELFFGLLYNKTLSKLSKLNLSRAIDKYEGVLTVNQQKHSIHPYLTFVNTPYSFKNNEIQHNSIGLRQCEEVQDSFDGLRILCIGGSTTYGNGVQSPNQAWPKILEELLQVDTNCRVYNAGLSGATSKEWLTHYLFRYNKLKPNIAFIHGGINDATAMLFSDYNDEYTHFRGFESSKSSFASLKAFVYLAKKSNTFKYFFALYLNNVGVITLDDIYLKTNSPNIEKIDENKFNDITELPFYNNLENLVTVLIKDSVRPVLFKPHYVSKYFVDNQLTKEVEQLNDYSPTLLESYYYAFALNEKIMDTIGKKYNLTVLSLNENAIELEHFLDPCHLDEYGQEDKAEFIFQQLFNVK